MTALERETEVLERVRASLVADGFDVIIQPRSLDLPEFLQNLSPDAIAHRGDEHLVVEVASRAASTQAKLRLIRHALHDRPGWHIRTVWTSGRSAPDSPELPPLEAVSASLKEVDELLSNGHLRPAFLMCWAALESLGRRLLPSELTRPQTPGRVIEHLGAQGLLSRREASGLRKLAKDRNRLVHGELHAAISEHDVIEIRDIIWRLHDLARDGASASIGPTNPRVKVR